MLYEGDCRAVLGSLPAESFDSIVTDPPYELGFMGRAWDAWVPKYFDLLLELYL
jgi:site-specific DNA-methyltransferase (adenine-specific)